jgi:ankyrin repeat protein
MSLEDLCGLLVKLLQSRESEKAIQLIESNPELVDIALELPSADESARCSRPIHHSAATGNEKVLRYLLKKGISADRPGYELKRPLHDAVIRHSCSAIKILVEAGANIDAENEFGETPIDFTVEADWDMEIVFDFLLSLGAKPGLGVAVRFGRLAMARSILEGDDERAKKRFSNQFVGALFDYLDWDDVDHTGMRELLLEFGFREE